MTPKKVVNSTSTQNNLDCLHHFIDKPVTTTAVLLQSMSSFQQYDYKLRIIYWDQDQQEYDQVVSPQVRWDSHKSGGRLPLLYAKSTVTLLANIKLLNDRGKGLPVPLP